MFAQELVDRAHALIALCRERSFKIATAESCTGGLVASLLTEIPGSSAVIERGFVVYANEAKQEMLGVAADLIAAHGAVSAETAAAMALGAIVHSRADVAVAVTGIAGPDGGTLQKPVGLVHFACARRGGAIEALERRYGELGRSGIRLAAVRTALDLLDEAARR